MMKEKGKQEVALSKKRGIGGERGGKKRPLIKSGI